MPRAGAATKAASLGLGACTPVERNPVRTILRLTPQVADPMEYTHCRYTPVVTEASAKRAPLAGRPAVSAAWAKRALCALPAQA